MSDAADKVVQGMFDASGWQSLLSMTEKGRLIECWQNVSVLLTHLPEWEGVLAFDAFAQVPVKRKPAPTGTPAGEWTPEDDMKLGLWLSQKHQLTMKSVAAISTGVLACANATRFHPVVDWLETLRWDETPRLDTWLHDCLGARGSPYTALVGRFFLMNMVRRVVDPGCIMRYVPVLEGAQNKGKSTALRILGGEWYSDAHLDLTSKDAFELIQGVWLQEIAEMGAFNKSEANRVKHFVSTVEDSWVPKYIRGRIRVKRQVAFAGTTNEKQYLKDWTGNTRFLPIRCMEDGEIDVDKLAARRDQLFAEALVAVRSGERAYATAEQEQILFAPEQEERQVEHPWREPIVEYLGRTNDSGLVPDKVTTNELLLKAVHVDTAKMTQTMQADVGRIMDSLGWLRKRDSKDQPGGAPRRWFYVRPQKTHDSGAEKHEDLPI